MAQDQGTKTSVTTQIHEVYIRATPQAIWEAITSPEWTVKYGYKGAKSVVRMSLTSARPRTATAWRKGIRRGAGAGGGVSFIEEQPAIAITSSRPGSR